MVYREETLLNVINSVTRNGRSILLTALFAIILVYLYSIIGFIFFKDDFLMEADQLPQIDQGEDANSETCDADGGCPNEVRREEETEEHKVCSNFLHSLMHPGPGA